MYGIVKTYIITFIVFMAIDLVWLGIVAKNLYAKHLGYIMRTNVNWVAAIVFYLLFIAGVLFFVLYPAIDKDSWRYALLAGMLFGFITYATYDLTNLATLKDWPVIITIIDLIWGAILCGATSVISFLIIQRLR